MARPTNPLPDTSEDRHLVDFARGLRNLRTKAGSPNLATMSERSGVCMSALSGAQGGHRMPTWRTVEGYVQACGADSTTWRARWQQLQFAQHTTHARGSHATIMKNWAGLRRSTPPQWPMDEAELAEVLNQVRKFRGLSLRDMARRGMGYSHHTYGAVLRGDRPVTASVMLAILHACAVGPDEIRRWLQVLARVQPTQALHVQSLLSKMPAPRTPLRMSTAGMGGASMGGTRKGGAGASK